MKKTILFIVILIFSAIFVNTVSSDSSTDSVSDNLEEGETKEYHLSNLDTEITLKTVYKRTHTETPFYEAYFIFDGRKGGYREGRSTSFDGIIFEVNEIDFKDSPEKSKVEFTITVQTKCGDNICGGSENCYTCPQDCGCKSEFACNGRSCNADSTYFTCGDNVCNNWQETCYEDNCCNGRTVDLNNNNKNCGACWNACEEGYACEDSICVLNTKDDLSYYPQFFVKEDKLDVAIIVGDKAHSSHVLAQTQVVLSLSDYIFRRTGVPTKGFAMLASEIGNIDNFNIVSIGNACDNEVTAKILENPEPCNNLKPGEAAIEVYRSKSNKAHIVLNAYSDGGIKKAAEVISRYPNYDLNGNKFIIEVEEKEKSESQIAEEEFEEEDEKRKEIEGTNVEEEKQKIIEEFSFLKI